MGTEDVRNYSVSSTYGISLTQSRNYCIFVRFWMKRAARAEHHIVVGRMCSRRGCRLATGSNVLIIRSNVVYLKVASGCLVPARFSFGRSAARPLRLISGRQCDGSS